MNYTLLAIALLVSTEPAFAVVHKCTRSDGTSMFSDTPCPPNTTTSQPPPKLGPEVNSRPKTMEQQRQEVLDAWDKQVKDEIRKGSFPALKTLPQSSAQESPAVQQPQSESTAMGFEVCNATVRSTIRSLNVPPQNVRFIVNTSTMTMTKICTNDGGVLITCSRPDQKMVTTRSSARGC